MNAIDDAAAVGAMVPRRQRRIGKNLVDITADRLSFIKAEITVLKDRDAAERVHGEMLRYEPQTNKICLGYWTKPEDWAEWKFTVNRPGVYELEVWQGCGRNNGGSDVRVEVADQTFDFVVDETGHFQSFIPRRLGRVHFAKAGDRVSFRAIRQSRPAAALTPGAAKIAADRCPGPRRE